MTNYYTKQARIERLEKENQKLRDEISEMAKQIVELHKLILEKDRTITIMDDELLLIKTDGGKGKLYKEDDDNIVLC